MWSYGRISACTGSADDYVKQVLQAIDQSDTSRSQHQDSVAGFPVPGLQATPESCGKGFRPAMDRAGAHAHNDEGPTKRRLGFNVERWVESLRARLLVRMGNFTAAAQSIAKLTSSEKIIRIRPFSSFRISPGSNWPGSRTTQKLADLHSIRIDEIAASSRIPYVAVYAAVCKALVAFVVRQPRCRDTEARIGDPARDRSLCGNGISKRNARLPRRNPFEEQQPGRRPSGSPNRGIAVARERHARLAECRSTIILALVLSEGKLSHPNYQASDLLSRARAVSSRRPARCLTRACLPRRSRRRLPADEQRELAQAVILSTRDAAVQLLPAEGEPARRRRCDRVHPRPRLSSCGSMKLTAKPIRLLAFRSDSIVST